MRLAGVHQPHPLHGVCGFQFLGCARTLGKLRDNEVKAATDGGFNLGAMLIEGFACDKGGVDLGGRRIIKRRGDPAVLIASSAKCKKALGWNPTRSSTEEIIAAAWKWHLSHPYGYGGEKQKESL